MGVGSSKVHRAAGSGDTETLAQLVRVDPDVIKSVNDERYTPLHAAALYGHFDCAVFLIAKGADVDPVTTTNATPLHFAALHGHLDVVRVLCDNNASLDKTNSQSRSALMLALYHRHDAVALELVHRGANVNVVTKRGDTAGQIARRFKLKGVGEAITAAEQGKLQPRLAEAREAAKGLPPSSHASRSRHGDVDSTAGTSPRDSPDGVTSPGEDLEAVFSAPYDEEGGAFETMASRTIDGHPACLSCLVRPSNVVLLPCSHLCLCADCREGFDAGSKLFCPKCRMPVAQMQVVTSA